MGIGFNNHEEEIEEEYIPLYKTIIECTICGDKDLFLLEEGVCSCENVTIGLLESKSKVRHVIKSTWTHFKTVSYKSKKPKIYEVLIGEELP